MCAVVKIRRLVLIVAFESVHIRLLGTYKDGWDLGSRLLRWKGEALSQERRW